MLPEGHEIAALDRLVQLQQDHELLDRPLEAIDMRLPDRLVLRPQPPIRPRNRRPEEADMTGAMTTTVLPLPLREGAGGRGA